MRPFLVILLVAAAVGAFFFALNLGGGSEEPQPLPGPGGPTRVTSDDGPDPSMINPGTDDRSAVIPVPSPSRTSRMDENAVTGNAIRGRVELASGERVPDAQVSLSRFDPFDFLGGAPTPDDDVRMTSTDGRGQFVFVDVDPFVQYTVTATHPEHGRRQESHVQVADGEQKDGVVIVLQPGARLFGRVTDVGGAAVRRARVTLGMSALGTMNEDPNAIVRTTADDGSFSFPNVAEGNYSLDVVADGYGRTTIAQLNVTGQDDLEQNVELDVAYMMHGRVVDQSGAPVPEAEVQAWGAGGRTQQTRSTVTTDEDGQFLFDDVASGEYTLFVRKEGFRNERYSHAQTGDMTLSIVLTPLPRIRGQALDPQGKALANFDVNLRVPVQNTDDTIALRENSAEIRGSQDGQFELACPNQGEYVVEVRCEPYAPTLSERITVTPGAEIRGIVVRMTAGGAIRGRVVDYQGHPVAGARIQTHDSDYVDDAFFRSLGEFPSAATEKEGVSAADGTFQIGGLTPETYQLDIRHLEFAQLIKTGIVVREGQPFDVGDLALTMGAKVSGTVIGPNGAPLAGATVQMRSEGENAQSYTARTDAEGRYTVPHVAAGSYFIFAQRATDPSNPFQGPMDQKRTQRMVPVREGGEYTEDFTITG